MSQHRSTTNSDLSPSLSAPTNSIKQQNSLFQSFSLKPLSFSCCRDELCASASPRRCCPGSPRRPARQSRQTGRCCARHVRPLRPPEDGREKSSAAVGTEEEDATARFTSDGNRRPAGAPTRQGEVPASPRAAKQRGYRDHGRGGEPARLQVDRRDQLPVPQLPAGADGGRGGRAERAGGGDAQVGSERHADRLARARGCRADDLVDL